MTKFIEDVEHFSNQINMSLIERGQIIDSLDILLEKVADSALPKVQVDNREQIKIQSLLEVLLISFKNNQATDEDTLLVFEQKYLIPEKKRLREVSQ